MRVSNQIVLASTNRHKFEEFTALFRSYSDVELVPAETHIRNAEKIGMVEKYETYLENAMAKARLANQAAHLPCLADDSGLEVEALGGKPGVRTHRFAIPKAGQSQDEANIQKLLEELKGRPMNSLGARFQATLVLVMEGMLIHANGVLEGTIAEAPSGTHGFGYDPIFIPKGQSRTLADMRDDEKNAISHRSRALHALMSQCKVHGITFAKP